MCSQRRTRRNDKRHAHRHKDSQQNEMVAKRIRSPALSIFPQEKQVRGRSPEYGAGPVADEGKEANGDDVEAADAVVGAGEVDGGDCVGAAKGEEGYVLEEDGGGGDFGDGEVG